MKQTLILKDKKLIFQNFSGKVSDYNKDGERKFSVLITDEVLAQDLLFQGWGVKLLRRRPEDPDKQNYHLPVKVNYDGFYKPRIFKVTALGKLALTEDTVGVLDFLPLEYADVELNPSTWKMNGKTGITAYLVSLYAHVAESQLDLEYRDVRDLE